MENPVKSTDSVCYYQNGKPAIVEKGKSIGDILKQAKLTNQLVLVEINSQPVKKENYALTKINNGDRVELVIIAAGG